MPAVLKQRVAPRLWYRWAASVWLRREEQNAKVQHMQWAAALQAAAGQSAKSCSCRLRSEVGQRGMLQYIPAGISESHQPSHNVLSVQAFAWSYRYSLLSHFYLHPKQPYMPVVHPF